MLGKHHKSEMLWELLSVMGSCSSIGPYSGRHFHAPLATVTSIQDAGSGLTGGVTGAGVRWCCWYTARRKEPHVHHVLWENMQGRAA